MKTLLDLFPALAFFGVYLASDIYTATIALIGSLVALVLVYRIWEKRWHKAHGIGAIVALVLGGATLVIRDPNFIMLKPTAVYALFALALLASHFIGEQPILQRLGGKQFALPDSTWRLVNLAWVAFFVACAAINLFVAYQFDEATWVKFKTFGFSALMFVFLIAHAPFLAKHLNTEDEKDAVRHSGS